MYAVQYGSSILNSRVEVNESAASQTIYTNEVRITYSIKVRVLSKDSGLPFSDVSVNVFQQNQSIYCRNTTDAQGIAECNQTYALGRGVLKIDEVALEPYVEKLIQSSV